MPNPSDRRKQRRRARSAATPPRGGRPSREEAAKLRDRILDAATGLFFAHGFGATTIDDVAAHARVSKRTFYDRFDDKAALFGAVLHRIVEGLRPPAAMPLIAGAGARDILRHLAGIILRAALMPQSLALHRLIVAESARFPKLAAAVANEGGTAEAIRLIAGLLERETRSGALAVADAPFAAEQFLQMVLVIPQRRALGLGTPMTPKELERWARDVVDLFLDGARGAAH